MSSLPHPTDVPHLDVSAHGHVGYQAYRILQAGFVAAPIIAGVDKFTHLLTNWDQYLAPWIAAMFGGNAHGFMMFAGVVEIAAGIGVLVKPKIFAYVVAAWLLGIIINLLSMGAYFDIALRDLGLMLGALALGRLAMLHDHGSMGGMMKRVHP
jgi:hypothetical protein